MELNLILDPLKEMAYPAEFSMDKLKSLPSYAARLRYVDSLLVPISNAGSSRKVYKIDDEKVLKVAKNPKGLDQNRIETDWSLQNYSIIARVFDSDQEDKFLEMEFAPKITASTFKKILGFSLNDLRAVLDYENRRHKGLRIPPEFKISIHDELLENEWVQDLIDVAVNYGFVIPGDFCKANSYGLVDRDGVPNIVLIDFGFTEDVYEQHYKRK